MRKINKYKTIVQLLKTSRSSKLSSHNVKVEQQHSVADPGLKHLKKNWNALF